jgi:hypothetical protein
MVSPFLRVRAKLRFLDRRRFASVVRMLHRSPDMLEGTPEKIDFQLLGAQSSFQFSNALLERTLNLLFRRSTSPFCGCCELLSATRRPGFRASASSPSVRSWSLHLYRNCRATPNSAAKPEIVLHVFILRTASSLNSLLYVFMATLFGPFILTASATNSSKLRLSQFRGPLQSVTYVSGTFCHLCLGSVTQRLTSNNHLQN